MKIVQAKNNSIAVAGDIHINIAIKDGQIDSEKLLCDLQNITGKELQQLSEILKISDASAIPIGEIPFLIHQLFCKQNLFQQHQDGKFLDLANNADDVTKSLQSFSKQAREVHKNLGNMEFERAHKTLGKMIANEFLTLEQKSTLSYDYFQTGYLHFSNSGDKLGLSQLFSEGDAKFYDLLEPQFLCLLSEMQQEVATREQKIELLQENLERLHDLENRCANDKIAIEGVQILQALCLRRIGERGDEKSLRKSVALHKKLHTKQSKRIVEISNNYGISLIRLYEATGNAIYLSKAEKILVQIQEPKNGNLLSELQSYPKALNNLGNVYKQRVAQTGDIGALLKAVENYTIAEKYWSEEKSPYEWAMLQKNKAESRMHFARRNPVNKEFIDIGIQDIQNSLVYRTSEQAPHQNKKSTTILKKLESLSD